jgi:hypothetical protein
MLSDRTPPQIVAKKFKQAGWRTGRKPVCPNCLATAKPKTDLEEKMMSDGLTDNRSQSTYPVGGRVAGVRLSSMRRSKSDTHTSLGVGLPADWPWSYMTVHVNVSQGYVVITRQNHKNVNSRKLPVLAKPTSPRRWLEISWNRLGVADPDRTIPAHDASATLVGEGVLRIAIPERILSALREAQQNAESAAAANIERNNPQPAQEGDVLQDLRDARDMLNQALIDAEKAGHEVEAYVVSGRVKVRRYIRQSEDV